MPTETKTVIYKSIHLNSPTKYIKSVPISLKLNNEESKEYQPKTVTKIVLKSSSSSSPSSSPQSSSSSSSTTSFEKSEKSEKSFGLCDECNKPNTSKNYCSSCCSFHFKNCFNKWKSGNDDIDKLIKSLQTSNKQVFIEWIPYDDLQNVKYFDKGGFSTIYSALWKKGQIINWNISKDDWNRSGEIKVALKRLYNSQNISKDFLYKLEVSLFHCSSNQHKEIMPIYGITQDPITKDYMIITKFVEQGNLRKFIYNNFFSLSWLKKLEILHSIIIGLNKIHSSGLSHDNFHSGNIFIIKEEGDDDEKFSILISDLGISGPADESYDDTFGIVQYTPPEILRGHNYTKYSDIYFFAMLMYEVSIGLPPFTNIDSIDKLNDLIFDICDGFRPRYNNHKDMPKCFENIMKQCWDDDQFSRPLTYQLINIIENWINEIKNNNNNSDIFNQFNNKSGQQQIQIRFKSPLYKYDIYKSQKIKPTDFGDDDFTNYYDNNEITNFEGIEESDEDIEFNEDFDRRAQNKFVTLKRSDLMKWLEDINETFDPNKFYPK